MRNSKEIKKKSEYEADEYKYYKQFWEIVFVNVKNIITCLQKKYYNEKVD